MIYASLKMLGTSWNPISANQGSTEETASAWWAWASLAASLAAPRSSVKMQPKHKSMKSQKSFKSLQIEPKYVQIVCNNCRHRLCTFAGRIPGRCLNVIFLPNSTEGIYFLLTPLQAYNWKSLGKAEDAHGSLKKQSATALQSKALQAQGYQAMEVIQVLQEVVEEVLQHCPCPLRYQRKWLTWNEQIL